MWVPTWPTKLNIANAMKTQQHKPLTCSTSVASNCFCIVLIAAVASLLILGEEGLEHVWCIRSLEAINDVVFVYQLWIPAIYSKRSNLHATSCECFLFQLFALAMEEIEVDQVEF